MEISINTNINLLKNNKSLYKDQGEMLFTRFGMTGPLVLKASRFKILRKIAVHLP